MLVMLVTALVSCASRESGYKISDETIAFIQPRVTTRSDLIENLGPPLLEINNPHVIAYSWGKLHATGARPSAVRPEDARETEMASTLRNPDDEPGLVESRRWICCIALDSKDRVARMERIKLAGAGSLEQAVRAWAGPASLPE